MTLRDDADQPKSRSRISTLNSVRRTDVRRLHSDQPNRGIYMILGCPPGARVFLKRHSTETRLVVVDLYEYFVPRSNPPIEFNYFFERRKQTRCACIIILLSAPTTDEVINCNFKYSNFCSINLSICSLKNIMNALTRATTTLPRAGHRMYSRQVIQNIENKPIWLSDIGAYPVMAICAGACVGAGSYIAYKFTSSPDVRVDKNKRGSEIRWWGKATN